MLAVVFFLLGYFALFSSAPLDGATKDLVTNELIKRFEYQVFLLLNPVYLWQCWIGGDPARVNVLDRLPILFVAAIILAIAYVVGRLLVELIGADRRLLRLEIFVFSLGVGLSVLSLLTLLMGLMGLLRRPLVFALPIAVVLIVAAQRWLRRAFRPGHQKRRTNNEFASVSGDRDDWLPAAVLWLAVPFVAVILMGAMLPPRHFDVREYHLQVPKEWYQQGRIGFLEHNVYGNMPLGAEMHALLGMVFMPGKLDWWLGALVGKTVVAAFVPLTMLGLLGAGTRFNSTTAGVVAGLVYASVPWMAHVSMAGLIEGALACYLFLAVYAALIWWQEHRSQTAGVRRTGEESTADVHDASAIPGHLLLAGFLAGSAVACKYPALLFVAAPLAAAVLVASRHWKPLVTFLLAATFASGLWFGKNWVLAGNPTYPLLYEVFGGRTRTPERDAQWKQAHAVPRDELGRRYSLAQFRKSASEVALTGTLLSPLLIPLAVLSLGVRRHRSVIWILFGLSLYVIATWWLLTHRIERFWIPVLPVVALMAGVGATWSSWRLWRYVLVALLVAGMLGNFLLIASPSIGDVRFFVALDDLRVDAPRETDPIPTRIDPAHRVLNNAVPAGCQALLVGDAQPFDLEVPVLYNTCFDPCVFEKLMKGRSADERLAILHKHRISHVYLQWAELERYRSPGNYGYAAGSDFVQPSLFEELVAQEVLGQPVDILPNLESPGARPRGQIYPVIGGR